MSNNIALKQFKGMSVKLKPNYLLAKEKIPQSFVDLQIYLQQKGYLDKQSFYGIRLDKQNVNSIPYSDFTFNFIISDKIHNHNESLTNGMVGIKLDNPYNYKSCGANVDVNFFNQKQLYDHLGKDVVFSFNANLKSTKPSTSLIRNGDTFKKVHNKISKIKQSTIFAVSNMTPLKDVITSDGSYCPIYGGHIDNMGIIAFDRNLSKEEVLETIKKYWHIK